jgi:serine/threonine-protein kinase
MYNCLLTIKQFLPVGYQMTIAPGNSVGGHYEIIAPLGSGNFGQTYLAMDTHYMNRKCVIKRFNFSSINSDIFNKAQELFTREAGVLYQLNPHQNQHIPQFFAYFNQGKEFYLVEEWIDGQTLYEELKHKHQLKEDEVVDLVEEVLEVLKCIHSQGIIHRDIKPENLMRRNSNKKIVLIDFGAVKEEVAKSTTVTPQKKATQIYTLGYAPPEQVKGIPQPNSDIYALGMTALQLLTGLEPEDLKDTKTGEVILPRDIEVSDKLAQILNKMVCEQHWQRYQSAEDVIKDVEQYRKTQLALFGLNPLQGKSLNSIAVKKTISPLLVFAISAPIVTVIFLVISFLTIRNLVSPNTVKSDTTQTTKKPQTSKPQKTPLSSPDVIEGEKTNKKCPPILAPGQRC